MDAPNAVVLVMGVSGCGKSTLASEVARRLGAVFVEGDDFHPASNREKMHAGIALTDEDRAGWLASLRRELERRPDERVVLTCSALKRAYRDTLLSGLGRPHLVVFLSGSQELLVERLLNRSDHFVGVSLLASQLATLEEPQQEEAGPVLRVPIELSTEDQVRQVLQRL